MHRGPGQRARPARAASRRLAALAALGAAALLAACDEAEDKRATAETPPPTVTVAGVTAREITDLSRFVGTVEPVDRAEIVARVEGFLAERLVEDGARVEQDQPLFRIQPDQYEAALAQAKADLAETEANLALAEIELERDAKLLKSNTIAQSRYDATKATRDATAALVAARRAQVRQAELNLGYTEIASPFAGRIGRIAYAAGEVVGPGKGSLAVLVRMRPIEVAFSVSERAYLDVIRRIGGEEGLVLDEIRAEDSPTVTLLLPGGERYPETGAVSFIDNAVDPRTGTIAVRARFENARGLLAPGIYATVEIEQRESVRRLTVPQTAVQRDQKGDFVLVVGPDGLVKQRHVTLGRQTGTDFIVEDGLQEGESVITEGLQRVRPGTPVETVQAGN